MRVCVRPTRNANLGTSPERCLPLLHSYNPYSTFAHPCVRTHWMDTHVHFDALPFRIGNSRLRSWLIAGILVCDCTRWPSQAWEHLLLKPGQKRRTTRIAPSVGTRPQHVCDQHCTMTSAVASLVSPVTMFSRPLGVEGVIRVPPLVFCVLERNAHDHRPSTGQTTEYTLTPGPT